MELIELHIIQSFPVTCLNRDDLGSPKTAVFGGCSRARISSQCWKRAIRSLAKEFDLDLFAGRRTRFVIRELEKLFVERGVGEQEAKLLAEYAADALGKLDDVAKGNVKTLLYFSPGELESVVDALLAQDWTDLVAKILQIRAEESKSKKAKKPAEKALEKIASKAAKALKSRVKDAADIAIFGRMVADDHSLMLEGAGLFSHALSTHAAANEIDFFSAVDDLNQDDRGAGHIGTLEFNSACYYRYVGLNLDLLRDPDHLGHFSPPEFHHVVDVFLRSAILAVPAARKNSMFGMNPPVFVLGLRRRGQPLSLMNAFEQPIQSSRGYVQQSIEALQTHWQQMAAAYSLQDDVLAQATLPQQTIEELVSTLTSGN
jgi:CRISPR system Cascade subunit CasC